LLPIWFIKRKKSMSKHLGNMKRLYEKLTSRYGLDDELALKVKHELELLKVLESRKDKYRLSYSAFKNRAEPPGAVQ
jgi:hypothetical protein